MENNDISRLNKTIGLTGEAPAALPFSWRDLAKAERAIGRLDVLLADETLYEKWILVESRLEATRRMSLLGELVHVDRLISYENGIGDFTRWPTTLFPETLGVMRAIRTVMAPGFPAIPSEQEVCTLVLRCLSLSKDKERETIATTKAEVMDLVSGILDYWDTLDQEDGLVSVARGVQECLKIAAESDRRSIGKAMTHLAMMATPLLLKRFCGAKKGFLLVSNGVATNSYKYHDALAAGEEAWISYFIWKLSESADKTAHRAYRLKNVLNRYRTYCAAKSTNSKAPALTDYLFERPLLCSSHLEERFGLSINGANHLLKGFRAAGLIEAAHTHEKFKTWEARQITALSEGSLSD